MHQIFFRHFCIFFIVKQVLLLHKMSDFRIKVFILKPNILCNKWFNYNFACFYLFIYFYMTKLSWIILATIFWEWPSGILPYTKTERESQMVFNVKYIYLIKKRTILSPWWGSVSKKQSRPEQVSRRLKKNKAATLWFHSNYKSLH